MTNPNNAEKLWKLMFRADAGIRNYQHRQSACPEKHCLSLTQIRIVGCIFMSPDGRVKLKDIADELALTPGAVSQAVDNLVRKKFIVREQNPVDRRAVSITLSECGLAEQERIDKAFTALFSRFLQDIPESDQETFCRILEKILEVLKIMKGEKTCPQK